MFHLGYDEGLIATVEIEFLLHASTKVATLATEIAWAGRSDKVYSGRPAVWGARNCILA
jgi:hypothetical protein